MKVKKVLLSLVALLVLIGGGIAVTKAFAKTNAANAATKSIQLNTTATTNKKAAAKPVKLSNMRKPIDWRLSSETIPYPNVAQHPNMWIHVSLEQQRVYLMDGDKVLYTIYASTGETAKGWGTPKGTFHIQAERGNYFYAPNVKEGAYDWVSFKGHGLYLFHSIPFDKAGHVIQEAADAQGKSESSHGCVHLTMADAKWFYQNIKFNTKVVID